MTDPIPLTDRGALALHRRRAGADPALFLHDQVAASLAERLEEVNRSFTAPLLVSGFPQAYADLAPGAAVTEDAETLAVDEGAHDLIVHALSLHWANDPVGQIAQARRALRPDGLFLCASFGGRTLHELRAALAEAETRLTGGLSPRVAPMGEIRDLGALLQRAGLALPVADSLTLRVEYQTIFHLMRDLRAMGETNALTARRRSFASKALFAEAGRIYTDAYGLPDGRIPATFEIVFLTGWAPSATQPQPLRPGSAATRLADALGVDETPAGDKARPDPV